jgi:Domain of unknown function (DUF4136)
MTARNCRQVNPWLALLLLTICFCATASAEKIRVHYDKSLDFTKFKTYGWAPHGAVAHPMLALDMVGAVEDALNARGLKKVESDPDLIIAFYGAVDAEVSMTSANPLYNATGGIPPFDPSMTSPGNSLYWDGYYGNNTVVVHPGQLVIDLIDFKNKKLVWRAFAAEAVSPNNPDKLMSEVNGTITKMFKEYPVK